VRECVCVCVAVGLGAHHQPHLTSPHGKMSDELYPISVLIEELKNDDTSVRNDTSRTTHSAV